MKFHQVPLKKQSYYEQISPYTFGLLTQILVELPHVVVHVYTR